MTSVESGSVPAGLVEDSYLAKDGRADAVWRQLQQVLPAALVPELCNCVFVLMKPDAFASGAYRVLFDETAKAGWQPVYCRTAQSARPADFEELYKYNLTDRNEQNMLSAWWLNAPVYSMGPSLAVMFRVPSECRDRGMTAHETVRRRKGPSNPYEGKPGQLRFEARATNLALNLIHTADDPLSTLREFLIFDGPDELRAALTRSVSLKCGTNSGGGGGVIDDASVLAELMTCQAGDLRLDLPAVLVTIKFHLLGALRERSLRACLAPVYEQYRVLAGENVDAASKWHAFTSICSMEAHTLDVLATDARDSAIIILQRKICDRAQYSFELAEEAIFELDRRHVAISPWIRLAFMTSMYYADHIPW